MYRIIFMTRLWHAANKKEVLGMKKWVCLFGSRFAFSAVYVGAQAGMSEVLRA